MGLWDYSHSVALLMYLLDFGTDQRVWHYLVFYWAWELLPECDIIGFSIGLSNWSESVALLVFLWDFWTVLTVCHYLFYYWTLKLFREFGIIGFSFFYWTLELFRQCGIICFDMELWNCSDSVALFVFICDFGTVPTVWHYLFVYGT